MAEKEEQPEITVFTGWLHKASVVTIVSSCYSNKPITDLVEK